MKSNECDYKGWGKRNINLGQTSYAELEGNMATGNKVQCLRFQNDTSLKYYSKITGDATDTGPFGFQMNVHHRFNVTQAAIDKLN